MKKLIALVLLLILFYCLQMCSPGGERPGDFLEYEEDQYERVSINYEIQGEKDTLLVFIHGWNLDHSYWSEQVKTLKSDYRILNLDLAGHGNSGKDRTHWTAEGFARDIATIIEKQGGRNVILIGHSLGAEIALEVLTLIPEKVIGFIGVESFRNIDFEITPAFLTDFRTYLSKFKRNYEEMAGDFARENVRSTNRDVINRIVRDYKKADPKIALAVYKNMFPKYEEDKNKLRNLDFKLYIIASDYLPYNEDALRKYAKQGYEIYWINSAGHFPMVEQPEQFDIALQKILADIRSGSR